MQVRDHTKFKTPQTCFYWQEVYIINAPAGTGARLLSIQGRDAPGAQSKVASLSKDKNKEYKPLYEAALSKRQGVPAPLTAVFLCSEKVL